LQAHLAVEPASGAEALEPHIIAKDHTDVALQRSRAHPSGFRTSLLLTHAAHAHGITRHPRRIWGAPHQAQTPVRHIHLARQPDHLRLEGQAK
jgi:hypothetical protein